MHFRFISCLLVPYIIQPLGLCQGVRNAEICPFKENTLSNQSVFGTFPFGEFLIVEHFIAFVYREVNLQIVFSPEKLNIKCCAFFNIKKNDTKYWKKCSISQLGADGIWKLLDHNSKFPLRDIQESVTHYFCIFKDNKGVALQVTKR